MTLYAKRIIVANSKDNGWCTSTEREHVSQIGICNYIFYRLSQVNHITGVKTGTVAHVPHPRCPRWIFTVIFYALVIFFSLNYKTPLNPLIDLYRYITESLYTKGEVPHVALVSEILTKYHTLKCAKHFIVTGMNISPTVHSSYLHLIPQYPRPNVLRPVFLAYLLHLWNCHSCMLCHIKLSSTCMSCILLVVPLRRTWRYAWSVASVFTQRCWWLPLTPFQILTFHREITAL